MNQFETTMKEIKANNKRFSDIQEGINHDEHCACYDCMQVIDSYDPQPQGDFSGASFYEDGSR